MPIGLVPSTDGRVPGLYLLSRLYVRILWHDMAMGQESPRNYRFCSCFLLLIGFWGGTSLKNHSHIFKYHSLIAFFSNDSTRSGLNEDHPLVFGGSIHLIVGPAGSFLSKGGSIC